MKNNQLSEFEKALLEDKARQEKMLLDLKSISKAICKNDKQTLKNYAQLEDYKDFLTPIIEQFKNNNGTVDIDIKIECTLENDKSIDFVLNELLNPQMLFMDSNELHDLTLSEIGTLRIKNVLSKNPSATLVSSILIIYHILKDAILPDLPKELSLEELRQSIMSYIESHYDQLENNTQYTQICTHLDQATLLFIFYDKTNFLEENNDLDFLDFLKTEKLAGYSPLSEFLKTHTHPQSNDFSQAFSNYPEQDIVSILDDLALDDDQLRDFRIWAYMEAILQLDQAIDLMIQLSLFDQNKFLIEGKPVIAEDHPLLNNRLLLRKLNGKKLNQAGNERKSQIYADYQAFLREHFMADEHKHKFKSVYDAANHLYPQYKDKLISYMQEHMEKNSHNTYLQQDHLYKYIKDFIKQDDQLKKHLIAQDIEKQ